MFSIALPMNHDSRRRRFLAWYAREYGNLANGKQKFIEATRGGDDNKPLTKGRISQLFDPEQAFGEAAARSLARRLQLPEDIFLVDSEATLDQEYVDFDAEQREIWVDMLDIRNINPDTYANLKARIHAMAEGARASDAVLGGHSKNGYVDPDRIRQTLGKLKSPVVPDAATGNDKFRGGTSDFGELDALSSSQTSKQKKGKRR